MAQNTPVEMVRHASTLSVFVVLLGAFTRTFFQGRNPQAHYETWR
jgi:hypothetical protein